MSYNHLCQQKQNFIMVHFMKCFRRIIRHHTLTLTASLLGPTRSMAEEGWQHAKDEPMEAKKEESEAEPDTTPQRKVKKALGMAITEANFREVALNACQQQLEAFGNPLPYLKHHLGPEGIEKLVNFGKQLSTAFPGRADLSYLDGTLLPRVLEETHVFRISLWQLGFLGCCSSKPPTFRVTAAALMDGYLTNTFLTTGLLLYQQPEDLPAEMQIPGFPGQYYFWTHSSASSTLMLAHVLLNLLHVDVPVLSPNLHQSMLAVHCRFGTAASDLATIAMENARFSAHGSIRKNHDVVTWAVKLHTLKGKGLLHPATQQHQDAAVAIQCEAAILQPTEGKSQPGSYYPCRGGVVVVWPELEWMVREWMVQRLEQLVQRLEQQQLVQAYWTNKNHLVQYLPEACQRALQAHQATSSKCLAAQAGPGGRKAREPCMLCGKLIAPGSRWAREQHSWHCPGSERKRWNRW